MSAYILHRSILVTPAIKPERFLKGFEMGADITLIDFEDSVPTECKEMARCNGIDFLCRNRDIPHTFALRPNKIDLEEGVKDIIALIDSGAKPDVIILPKVESEHDILIVDKLLSSKLESIQFYATIETARGVLNLPNIACASPRLTALILGSADLADDIGSTMDWESMLYARSRIIVAAADAGIDAIDTPFFNFSDPEGLCCETQRAKSMGYSGKIVIHPNQVQTINRIFSPDEEAINWAKMVIDAREKSRDSICVVKGKMVGPPMVNAARRTLAIASRNNAFRQQELKN